MSSNSYKVTVSIASSFHPDCGHRSPVGKITEVLHSDIELVRQNLISKLGLSRSLTNKNPEYGLDRIGDSNKAPEYLAHFTPARLI